MDSGGMAGSGRLRVIRAAATLLLVVAAVALAGEPAQTWAVQKAGVGELLRTNVFALTVLFIFLVAIIGTFLKSRSKDKCLRDFQGYHVTVETVDGRKSWGKLRVYNNAIELEYAQPRQGVDANLETTFILYDKQYSELRRICRYSDELTEENAARRKMDVRKTSNPSIFRRMKRWLGNAVNTFRDALLEAIGAAVAQVKKTHSSSAMVTTQDARISRVGESVVGYAARAYEPVLEKHIFDPVLVEELSGDRLSRHLGVLKEYSGTFVEILDVDLKGNFGFALNDREKLALNRDYDLEVEGQVLTVRNRKAESVVVKEIVGEGFREEINRVVGGGESVRLDIGAEPPEDAVVVFEGKRKADVIFPRARAWVRHGSVGDPASWTS